ncbi:UNVERIFIED_CONTAM: hypothetical protein PYX00_007123 [Menopon gallinae]|uniref:Uncharacterized protein n=1 Tax=Menopon gallinae TaxID=328185 RepID=A0AAW2HIF4_9NEOP
MPQRSGRVDALRTNLVRSMVYKSLDGDDVRVESRASANDIVEEAVIPARELLRVLKKYNSSRDRDLKARKTFWEFMHPRSSEAGASLEMPLKMRVGDFFAASAVTRLEFAFLISLWGLNADSLSEHVSTKDPEAAGKTEDTA